MTTNTTYTAEDGSTLTIQWAEGHEPSRRKATFIPSPADSLVEEAADDIGRHPTPEERLAQANVYALLAIHEDLEQLAGALDVLTTHIVNK